MLYDFAQWLESTPLSVTIKSITWIIPTVQSIHIITIGIVFVALLTVALRVLGQVRMDEPFDSVITRFSRWIRNGVLVLAATGFTLVLGEPIRELMSMSFWVKMTLLAIAITSALAFRRSMRVAAAGGVEPQFSAAAKAAAVATVMLWLAIIFLGRAIAYDVEVWGPLSLSPRA